MTQLALRFDAKAAKRAKEQAIAQVESNTSEEWAEQAEAAIIVCANCYTEGGFTSDDVWWQLDFYGAKKPHIKDALGPVMLRLRKAGVIKCTGEYRASERPESHGQPKRVWRRA
jgi:hypothetical protein